MQGLYQRYRHFDLLVDSRRLTQPDQTLFLALAGRRTDGHRFIPELLRAGVRHFVVLESWWVAHCESEAPPPDLSLYAEATFVAVSDVLAFLQELAAHHRRQFELPVVGITGSNGKTITKDWLGQLLEAEFTVCLSPRSYNSQVGVPLSVWQLNDAHQLAVFEAGISQAGEMEKLAHIIRPTLGVLTNLGEAHAAGFRSPDHKRAEKLKLFTDCERVIVPISEPEAINDLREWGKTVLPVANPPHPHLDHLPVVFRQDAWLAIAAAEELGLITNRDELPNRVRHFRAADLRLSVRAAANGCTLINDAYSNDLTSLAAALEFATTQAPDKPLTLFLTDLPQINQPPKDFYRRVAGLLAGRVSRLFAVGPQIVHLEPELSGVAFHHFATTAELLAALDQFQFHQETLLLKGARRFRLERLTDHLTRRRHRTVLEIDLDAIVHNLEVYRTALPAGVKVGAMVKASAYGSGSVAVVRALAAAGVDRLFVAYTDEGVSLREAGIELPIVVLNPELAEFSLLEQWSLEPVIADRPTLETALEKFSELPLHLEFDTGMNRLGFAVGEAANLACYFASHNSQPASVFTHLAASEMTEHDAFTQQQFERFDNVIAAFDRSGATPGFRHVLNSNGISRFPGRTYDLVRLGIGLYGVGDAQKYGRLRPVARLKAAISGLRDVEATTTIGYGRRGELARAGRIGIVSIGYADGLPRRAGEGRYALMINGKSAPIVGAICMDMCMVDLSDHPEVRLGEEVIIFGSEHPIEELARVAGTIPYEILTGIGSRVHRVYRRE